jgi:UDP-N-acetylmuramate dehydrogenase
VENAGDELLTNPDWRKGLADRCPQVRMRLDVPMAELTTFRLGGPVDVLVEPESPEEVAAVVDYLDQAGVPWMVMGLGSNLIVRDGGIRGAVIRLGKSFAWVELAEEGRVAAGAAISLSELSKRVGEAGLSGLEFAIGIPGSLGGAVFMNAGAYDGEMSQVVREVTAFLPGQGLVRFKGDDLCFGYRRSCLQNRKAIALAVQFQLRPGDKEEIFAKMADLTARREAKQPLEMPSAGSVFKRPPGHFAGGLIEAAGLKGLKVGGAQVSPKHAGFIVNTGTATAKDVLQLIATVQKRVFEHSGLWLETEVRVVGEDSQNNP